MKIRTKKEPLDQFLVASTIAAAFAFGGNASAQPPQAAPPQVSGSNAATDTDIKTGPFAKVGGQLAHLHSEYSTFLQRGGAAALGAFKSSEPTVRLIDSSVVIDAVAADDAQALLADLKAVGLQNGVAVGRIVSGILPIPQIKAVAALPSLQFARPAMLKTNAGLVTSQGDQAMSSDIARTTFGVTGAGVMVGTLSDSYNCLLGAATDVLTGDLPAGVTVLEDSCPGGTDEGRAMMQLIHDVAPGVTQAFHTAEGGQANFAQGILDLQAAGAKVIVDDVFYFAEPMFQDGEIAQAVDTVKAAGVSYFSSAGNQARKSYESTYRPSGVAGPFGILHDFDPSGAVNTFQQVTLPVGDTFFSFQWDEPYASVSGAPGSASDYDIWFCSTTSVASCTIGSTADNIGGDPIEVLGISVTGGPVTGYLAIGKFSGPANNFVKYVATRSNITISTFNTNSSTTFGHANAAGAEAVGAAFYFQTPPFGTFPPLLESFSSAGGTRILFTTTGARIASIVRSKPGIVGPDGTNTTFFGSDIVDPGDGSDLDVFPNFFGTSAAAPHTAAVAALLLDKSPTCTPNQVYGHLRSTATDMSTPRFDFNSGYGFVKADAALGPACPSGAVAGDLNIDGTADLAGVNSAGAVFYTTNLVNWIHIPGTLSQLVAGDLNADGKADLAGRNSAGAVFYTTNLVNWIHIPGTLSQLVAGDLNADGHADLAAINSAGAVFYTTNLVNWIHIPGTLSQLATGDLNGDGHADLAGVNSAGAVFYTTNLSNWINIPGTLNQVRTGDFNGDGHADLAGVNNAGAVFYTTNLSSWTHIPGTLSQLRTRDLNGDGKADLAGLNSAGAIFYTTNLSTWTNIPGTMSQLRTGDLNGDGMADLAAVNSAGAVFYTTNLSTWNNIAGTLGSLADY